MLGNFKESKMYIHHRFVPAQRPVAPERDKQKRSTSRACQSDSILCHFMPSWASRHLFECTRPQVVRRILLDVAHCKPLHCPHNTWSLTLHFQSKHHRTTSSSSPHARNSRSCILVMDSLRYPTPSPVAFWIRSRCAHFWLPGD